MTRVRSMQMLRIEKGGFCMRFTRLAWLALVMVLVFGSAVFRFARPERSDVQGQWWMWMEEHVFGHEPPAQLTCILPPPCVGTLEELPGSERDEQQLVVKIEKLGGSVRRDEGAPRKPVTSVFIRQAGLTDEDVKGISRLTGLHRLDVLGNPLTDKTLERVAVLSELVTLNVNFTRVTDKGLGHIKGLRKLRWLEISSIAITDDGLKNLRGLADLEVLNLNWSPVTDKGLEHIAQLPSLRELYLGSTKITDKGLVPLQRIKNLECLAIQGTAVSKQAVQALRKAFPRWTVVAGRRGNKPTQR
jgi:hypothetical protein